MTKTTAYLKDYLLSEGIFLIIIGIIMIYMLQSTTIIFSLLLSTGIFFIGIYRTINSIVTAKNTSSPFISIMSGLLLTAAGFYLMSHPLFNTLILTVAIAFFFVVESIKSFSIAIETKEFKQIFWTALFSGIIQLILAVLIIFNLNSFSFALLGFLIGINFVFSGITCISSFLQAKEKTV